MASVYYFDKRTAAVFAVLTLITGVARVVAGLHYPSDIVVGALVGVGFIFVYHQVLPARTLSLGTSSSQIG